MYPTSGSILNSKLSSSLSTSIIVKVENTTVGAIQTLTIKQSREMCIWEECGNEGIIEIHPKNATKISIDVTRIVFDDLRLTESLARGFINIQSQRIPFDIHIMDTGAAINDDNILSHILHGCWFRGYITPLTSNNFLITETADIACEYITSMRNAQNASYGGISRKISYSYDTIERATDLNGRRGSFNSSGISK